jgi:shikimate kinase
MKIFLIGYMSSGKSTLGPQLAGKLGLPFLDLDKEIEKLEGRSTGVLFLEEGEDYFRQLEKKTLASLIKSQPDFVMATGGGTPCYFNNMDVMKKNGITLYLQVSVKELVRRNLNSTELRPLLRGMNELEMQAFINDHLTQRLPYYKKASVTLKENEMDLERIVQEVRLMSHSR